MQKIQNQAEASFLAALQALGWIEIAPSADLMPRDVWAQAIAGSLFDAGCIPAERLEIAAIILDSPLGNASQLGAKLLKEKKIRRLEQAIAGNNFLAALAARAKEQAAKI